MQHPAMSDDEFRVQLERRIGSLRQQRELVQQELRERHSELNSIDRRIVIAEELYRQEYGDVPPLADGAPMHVRRSIRIRRAAAGQPGWRDALIATLEDAGTPLHAKEIWRRMSESGFVSDAADPVRSVVAVAIRTPESIHRAGPNVFALNGPASGETPQQGLPIDVAADAADEEEGEEQS
jgi:hypothetical protein